jgi:NAD(P)H-hydrate epimerase
MKKLFTTTQIRSLDKFAIEKLKFPSIMLMENAVNSIYEILDKYYNLSDEKKSFAIFAGKGNNGGDGIALARKLAVYGHKVTLYHLYKPELFSSDAKTNFDILKKIKSSVSDLTIRKISGKENTEGFNGYDFYIDAILGSGTDGNLKDGIASLVLTLNGLKGMKIAVDIPTGLNSETAYGETVFNADLTISLGGLKQCLFYSEGYLNSGVVEEGNIGVKPEIYLKKSDIHLVEKSDIKEIFPPKSKRINKYTSGRTCIIAGSGDYAGAPILVSKGAMKTGSGAVILAIPESIKLNIATAFPEVVIKSYSDYNNEYLTAVNVGEIEKEITNSDALIIGPGLGRKVATIEAVRLILNKHQDKKIIFDADAIFALSIIGIKKVNLKNSIITPHIGEFSKLMNVPVSELHKNLLKYGKEFVSQTKAILVLKGPRTLIFNNNGDLFIPPTGNEGLAKFGSGDVLSGIIGSLVAQGATLLNSAISGVYLHGLCGDLLKEKFTSYSYTSGQIIDEIPNAIKSIGKF